VEVEVGRARLRRARLVCMATVRSHGERRYNGRQHPGEAIEIVGFESVEHSTAGMKQCAPPRAVARSGPIWVPKVWVITLTDRLIYQIVTTSSLAGMTLVEVGVIACYANKWAMAGPHR
jgi:hypothetical protein